MKKIKLLLIAVPLLLMSCPNDDDTTSVSDELVGTWVGVDLEASGSVTIDFMGEERTIGFNLESFDLNYSITFTENPNELVSQGTFGAEVTYTGLEDLYEDEELDEDLYGDDYEFLTETATWVRNGDQLTIIEDGEPIVYTISELTETSLILTLSIVDEEYYEGGIPVNATYTFARE